MQVLTISFQIYIHLKSSEQKYFAYPSHWSPGISPGFKSNTSSVAQSFNLEYNFDLQFTQFFAACLTIIVSAWCWNSRSSLASIYWWGYDVNLNIRCRIIKVMKFTRYANKWSLNSHNKKTLTHTCGKIRLATSSSNSDAVPWSSDHESLAAPVHSAVKWAWCSPSTL